MAKAPKKVGDARRDPTPKEAEAIALAREAHSARPARVRPPAMETVFKGPALVHIQAPHTDSLGWGTQMMEAFGVDSYAVVERLMMGAGQCAPQKPLMSQEDADESTRQGNYALSFISALQPKGALEATLCLQMLAAHEATMKMSAGMHNAKDTARQADCLRMMNQTARTFTAQIEALSKLRTGGKQQVEVRYVYVDARTQTVVNHGGGPGGALPDHVQPQAPALGALGYAPAPGLPVWSADAGGDALPVASDPGQAALPDARGEQSRRSEGRGERQLRLRALDGGKSRRATRPARPDTGLPDDAA